MDAIKIERLSYRYPDGMEALRHISLQVPLGSKAAILGPNGAGKSTLIQHLNGLISAQTGSVEIMGETLVKNNISKIRFRVGVVFQNPDDQVFSPTVWEDVAFGPGNMGLSDEEIRQRSETALAAVGMRNEKNKAPHHLSYGQKKRVAIAGVLAMQPDIVILDEPMSYLDPKGKDEVAALLQALHFLGKTILVATHDVDFACEWADQVILMKEGEVIASGGTELLVDRQWIDAANLHFPRVARPFALVPGLKLDRLPKNEKEAARIVWELAGTQTCL